MKSKKWLVAASACAAGSLVGCGGGEGSSPPPLNIGPPQVQSFDTLQLLMLAQSPSESAEPLPVDGGLLVVTPVNDETSDPIPVTSG